MIRHRAAQLGSSLFLLWLLAQLLDPSAFYADDTAQYLSTAQNIRAGDGIVTDILYYDLHHAMGPIPAQQTMWPPGYPLLIVGASYLGLTVDEAAFFVNLSSLFLAGALIFGVLKQLGASPLWRSGGVMCWLLFQPAWESALEGLSGITAVALALASTLFYARATKRNSEARHQLLDISLAGGLAGLAFTVTYAFAYYILSLGICVLIWSSRFSLGAALKRLTAVVLSASLFVVPVLLRNYEVAGSLTSRPPTAGEATISTISVRFLYAVARLLGIDKDNVAVSLVSGTAALFLLGLLALGLYRIPNRKGLLGDLALPLIFVAATLMGITSMALLEGAVMMQAKYLAYVAPWVIIAIMLLCSEVAVYGIPKWAHPGLLLGLTGLVLLAQYQSFEEMISSNYVLDRNRAIRGYMATDIGGVDLQKMLAENVSRNRPLFANEPQSVWHALKLPVVGISKLPFSARLWDGDQVLSLLQGQHVGYVLVMPEFFGWSNGAFANQPFFRGLCDGSAEEYSWLKAVYGDNKLCLFEVDVARGRDRASFRAP
jgi:hypothetical protein